MLSKKPLLIEICTDSVEGALAAEQGGAQRIELCSNLVEGGVTPSPGLIKLARQSTHIGLYVLIRPRGGDFCYMAYEYEVMRQDVVYARQTGADGVVLGLLKPDGSIDSEHTAALVDLARPMQVTFHRAIDLCRDPFEALEVIAGLGIERVLTSGGAPTALQGAAIIARLVQRSAGRVIIIAGSGITAENLPALVAATGVAEVHCTARETRPSPMAYRSTGCVMGKAYQPEEYVLRVTTIEKVREVVDADASAGMSKPSGEPTV